ncbi:MAG: PepSY domain-containing protein [Alphaproteobacteria bacterium]|nr:PepSY domain-containing protein [Alphaproteobacteria bacterium]
MRKWWFSIHKWIGLVVGLQILAWTVSGLYMTWFPIEQVRSESNIREAKPRDLRTAVNLISAEKAIEAAGVAVSRLELIDIAGRWMWRIDSAGKPHMLIDAEKGLVVSPLDEDGARQIATADFAGEGKVATATLIAADPPIEYRSTLPVWQIVFDDPDATHLYVAPLTGKVMARRSALWRTYDFLWSLHIMDYSERENFNHWPIILLSLLGLILTITGFGLLVIRLWPRNLTSKPAE